MNAVFSIIAGLLMFFSTKLAIKIGYSKLIIVFAVLYSLGKINFIILKRCVYLLICFKCVCILTIL